MMVDAKNYADAMDQFHIRIANVCELQSARFCVWQRLTCAAMTP